MNPSRRTLGWLYWSLAIGSLIAAVAMALYYAPMEPTMGFVQKITYLHVPTAICTFLACLVVFVANVGFLWQRGSAWDDLAHGAAEIVVLFCSVVLLTGMVWARSAWGQWWAWSPLLTFSLVLWLLYLVFLVVRHTVRPLARREITCAVYGLIAFLDVPLVYLSVKLLPDKHPSDVRLTPEMTYTLLVWFIPVAMICAGLIHARYRHHQHARQRLAVAPFATGRDLPRIAH